MQARLHVIAPSFNLNVYLKDAVRGNPSTKQYFIAISTGPPTLTPCDLPWSHHSPEMAHEAPCQDWVPEPRPRNMAKVCFQCLHGEVQSQYLGLITVKGSSKKQMTQRQKQVIL